MKSRKISINLKFWTKVRKSSGCWNWTASKYRNGYGQFMVETGKLRCAHRVAWQLCNGTIPEGAQVLHKCDNRACVNPDHLFLGTHQDNMDDMVNKLRHQYGERQWKAKLSEENVLEILRLKGSKTQKEIGKIFGVGNKCISKIHLNQRWKHITTPMAPSNADSHSP